jgi:hypothetical protein
LYPILDINGKSTSYAIQPEPAGILGGTDCQNGKATGQAGYFLR